MRPIHLAAYIGTTCFSCVVMYVFLKHATIRATDDASSLVMVVMAMALHLIVMITGVRLADWAFGVNSDD